MPPEFVIEHCEGVIAHIAPHSRLEVDFFFLGCGQAREVNCCLISLTCFSDYCRIERIAALNRVRYGLLDVGSAVG